MSGIITNMSKKKDSAGDFRKKEEADKKKAKDKAEIQKIIKPNTGLKNAQNIARGIIVGVGIARAVTTAAGAGSSAVKSVPKTSKTMNVPKGTKVITSGSGGSANATSGVKKVTIQKSPARIEAGKKTYETVKKAKAATNAVNLATVYQGGRGVGTKKKK